MGRSYFILTFCWNAASTLHRAAGEVYVLGAKYYSLHGTDYSLSRRGSTAEADLSVIHKHFRHKHTHTHMQSPIPFSSHGTKDNWINSRTVRTLFPSQLIAPESAVTVSSYMTTKPRQMKLNQWEIPTCISKSRDPYWKEIASDHGKTLSCR